MAKALAAWAGGIHNLIEFAAREDGALFRRNQYRDPRFGYRWTKWARWGAVDVATLPEVIEAGFSTCRRSTLNARLPNV